MVGYDFPPTIFMFSILEPWWDIETRNLLYKNHIQPHIMGDFYVTIFVLQNFLVAFNLDAKRYFNNIAVYI